MSNTNFPYGLRKGDEDKTTFPYMKKQDVSQNQALFPYNNCKDSNTSIASFPYSVNAEIVGDLVYISFMAWDLGMELPAGVTYDQLIPAIVIDPEVWDAEPFTFVDAIGDTGTAMQWSCDGETATLTNYLVDYTEFDNITSISEVGVTYDDGKFTIDAAIESFTFDDVITFEFEKGTPIPIWSVSAPNYELVNFDFTQHNEFFGINGDNVDFIGDYYAVDMDGFTSDWFGADVNEINTKYVYTRIGEDNWGYWFTFATPIVVAGDIGDLSLAADKGRGYQSNTNEITIYSFENPVQFSVDGNPFEATWDGSEWSVE